MGVYRLNAARHLLLRCDGAAQHSMLTPDASTTLAEPTHTHTHMSTHTLHITTHRDPSVLEKPSPANGWRWRVMVGSNITLVTQPPHPHSISEPHADVSTVHGEEGEGGEGEEGASSSSDSNVSSQSAAGGGGGGVAGGDVFAQHEVTVGTATVYRSRTKELEGGG